MLTRKTNRQNIRTRAFSSLFLLFIILSPLTWALSETEQYFDQVRVLNEILQEVQLKYVDEDKVETKELITNAMAGMLKGLDPHSAYFPPTDYEKFKDNTRGTFGGLGITIDVREGWLTVVSPLPETPAFRAGIHSNDKIIKIEGESTEGIDIQDAVKQARGEPGTKVTITVFRPSDRSQKDYSITRDIIRVPNVYAYMIDDSIGYIRLFEFKQTSSSDMESALDLLVENGMETLILDLRFNSGGLLDMAVEISDKFLPKKKQIVSIRGREEGDERAFLSRNKAKCDLPMVVLVNQGSASASEIVAGAMQDWGRAIIVGPKDKRTFGKGSVQTVIPLSNGGGLKLTTAKYFTPLGRAIQDIKGIEPDIEVEVDEKFQIRLSQLGRIAYLPESIASMERLLPPIVEDDKEEEEVSDAELDSATDEDSSIIESIMGNGKDEKEDDEEKNADVYDKELAKAVEILKAQKIWAQAESLLE